jgi:hypothetical protein
MGPFELKNVPFKVVEGRLIFTDKSVCPSTRDRATVFAYATDNDLLQTDGWKKVGRMKRNVKFMKRMINAIKARKHDIRYKFGIRIPHNVKEAHRLDHEIRS